MMTKQEFEAEWLEVVRKPFDKAGYGTASWHKFAADRVQYLSPAAHEYIDYSPEIGSWLKERVGVFMLEKVLLQVGDRPGIIKSWKSLSRKKS